MKEFIKKIFFLGLLILSLIKIIDVLTKNLLVNNTNIQRVKCLPKKFENINNLFIGNSYLYSGVDLSKLRNIGNNSYSLAVSTSGTEYYKLLLDDYLKTNTSQPQNIFFLLSPMTFSSQSDNWAAYPIHQYLNNPISDEQLLIDGKCNFNNYVNLLINGFKKDLTNLPKLFKQTELNCDKIIKGRGFSPSEVIFNDSLYNAQKHLYLSLGNDVFNFARINEFLTYCKSLNSRGIKVYFFETPTFKLRNFFSEKYLMNYQKGLTTIAKNYQLIRAPQQFNSNHFCNIDHLNIIGAETFSNYLSIQINEQILNKK